MINTLTLNPAIDKILYVDCFKKNITARIKKTDYSIGGKGTHVSINLAIMGEKNNAFGAAHGMVGKQVISLLKEHDINVCFNYYDRGETRTNYLLNEKNGDSTLITEQGAPLSKEDIDSIIKKMRAVMKAGDYLALSGSSANYADPYVYNYIMENVKDMKIKVFLDSSGAALKKCLEAKPYLIKPNSDELESLVGHKISADKKSVAKAIAELDDYNIDVIAVSLGGNGSVVRMGNEYFAVTPPDINIKNTVGCGDCFLAGLLYGFSKEMNTENILRHATAVSAAAAESEFSVGFDAKRAEKLKSKIIIEEI